LRNSMLEFVILNLYKSYVGMIKLHLSKVESSA